MKWMNRAHEKRVERIGEITEIAKEVNIGLWQ